MKFTSVWAFLIIWSVIEVSFLGMSYGCDKGWFSFCGQKEDTEDYFAIIREEDCDKVGNCWYRLEYPNGEICYLEVHDSKVYSSNAVRITNLNKEVVCGYDD